MTIFTSRAIAMIFASVMLTGSAFAQATSTPSPTTPAATKSEPAAKKAEVPRTAASLECSKEADTKDIHGKERKKFMSKCKKDAKDAAKK